MKTYYVSFAKRDGTEGRIYLPSMAKLLCWVFRNAPGCYCMVISVAVNGVF